MCNVVPVTEINCPDELLHGTTNALSARRAATARSHTTSCPRMTGPWNKATSRCSHLLLGVELARNFSNKYVALCTAAHSTQRSRNGTETPLWNSGNTAPEQ